MHADKQTEAKAKGFITRMQVTESALILGDYTTAVRVNRSIISVYFDKGICQMLFR